MYIFLIIILIIFERCDFSDNKLRVTNTKNQSIAIAFSKDSLLTDVNLVDFYIANQINPQTTKIIYQRGSWSNYIKGSKNNKIFFFIIDVETLKRYQSMDSIKINKLYLKIVGLTEGELNKQNWEIIY